MDGSELTEGGQHMLVSSIDVVYFFPSSVKMLFDADRPECFHLQIKFTENKMMIRSSIVFTMGNLGVLT